MTYVQEYAGTKAMERYARDDVREALRDLIDQPRGTHCGKATPDSIAYIRELQRIFDEARERR